MSKKFLQFLSALATVENLWPCFARQTHISSRSIYRRRTTFSKQKPSSVGDCDKPVRVTHPGRPRYRSFPLTPPSRQSRKKSLRPQQRLQCRKALSLFFFRIQRTAKKNQTVGSARVVCITKCFADITRLCSCNIFVGN